MNRHGETALISSCAYSCIGVDIYVYIIILYWPLYVFFSKAIPEFISTPTSVNVTLGSTATFNCSSTEGRVGWIVNGSLLSHQITPDIRDSGAGTTSSLHVPAIEKYNNMTVTCIVFTIRHDLSDDLRSDPVVLRIQGMHSEQVFHVVIISRNLRRIFQSPFVQSTQHLPFVYPNTQYLYVPRLLYTQTQQVLGAV